MAQTVEQMLKEVRQVIARYDGLPQVQVYEALLEEAELWEDRFDDLDDMSPIVDLAEDEEWEDDEDDFEDDENEDDE
jgi:hypothetical protein